VETIFCRQHPDSATDERLAALLHDAPEYVVGDMISPFKLVVGGDYKAVEERIHRAIHQRFSLAPPENGRLKQQIKRADHIAAYFEATLLAGFSTAEAVRYFGRPSGIVLTADDLEPLSVKRIHGAFMRRFSELEKARLDMPRRRGAVERTTTG
jgi:5'-deoxynucleotidase YfbR-like HD superfamily hydrolase